MSCGSGQGRSGENALWNALVHKYKKGVSMGTFADPALFMSKSAVPPLEWSAPYRQLDRWLACVSETNTHSEQDQQRSSASSWPRWPSQPRKSSLYHAIETRALLSFSEKHDLAMTKKWNDNNRLPHSLSLGPDNPDSHTSRLHSGWIRGPYTLTPCRPLQSLLLPCLLFLFHPWPLFDIFCCPLTYISALQNTWPASSFCRA